MRTAARFMTMLVLCLGVGFIGWLFTEDAVADWYGTLKKPAYTPPEWVFGVVWPILYVMMAIAAGILWNKPVGRKAVAGALRLFLLQLILNGLWTPLFFGMHEIVWALLDVILLWILLLVTTIVFYVQSKPAGLLLAPYLVWTGFAVYLNAGFLLLNR